jgi:hypothetical protein
MISFLEPARAEFAEAIAFYEDRQAGLGREFAEEIKRTVQRVIDYPARWPKLSKNTRRCRTQRFPYGVVYQIAGEDILVVAIMHLQRRPGYWKDRLK